jgi:tRNA1(Val) A37 N6-methylase TrmN6
MIQKKLHQYADLSKDSLFNGRLTLYQPIKGYRVSVDAPLLIWFACREKLNLQNRETENKRTKKSAQPFSATLEKNLKSEADKWKQINKCADLGAGCGAIGLGLLATGTVAQITAVEIQPQLAELCKKNAKTNNLDKSYKIITGDLKKKHSLLSEESFDLVVVNPPFWPADSGKLPENREKRIACHEISTTLKEVLTVSARLMHKRRGRVCIVYPSRRFDHLMNSLTSTGLKVTAVQFVHTDPQSPSQIALIEARHRNSAQFKILPPLFLNNSDGNPTKEINDILSGKFFNPDN